jgi:predicted site-specific integrase-resolvase
MKRAAKPAPAADPARKQAVIYARVSSKEQEKEGFSIPAQLKLLKEYAAANGFAVAQEYMTLKLPSKRAAPPSARWWPISRRIRPFA